MPAMTLERTRPVVAPPAAVWEIVADLDGYHAHTDTLRDTVVLTGSGEGARRRCVDAGGADWEEACVLWEPGHRYAVEVDIPTYPLKFRTLFRAFRGTWTVEPAEEGSTVSLRFDAELRRIPGIAKVVEAMAKKNEPVIDAILDSYARAVEPAAAG